MNANNQDLIWTIEAELENANFHLMDTDLYKLWRGEEEGKRLFFTFDFYMNSLSREEMVKLLERVRDVQSTYFEKTTTII
jgi:hypothetical protein